MSKSSRVILLAIIVSSSAFGADPEPANPPRSGLAGLLHEISIPSGIHFDITPELARDPAPARPAGTAWPELIREVLRGYNHIDIANAQGRLVEVRITGRNGNGTAPPVPASPRPAENLFDYETGPVSLPAHYRNHAPGSVHSIRLSASRLRNMARGARVPVDLPDGHYVLVHDQDFQHENGDLSWVGSVEGAPGLYRALLTLGEYGVEGQIRTPGGLYHLESEDSGNWLVDINASGLQAGSLEGDGLIPFLPPGGAVPSAEAARLMKQANTAKTKQATLNAEGKVVIDLGLLHTESMATPQVATRLNNLVAIANQALADSRVKAVLRLVLSKQVNYPNSGNNSLALDRLTGFRQGFAGVPRLRLDSGADMMLLVRRFDPQSQGGGCGIAWVNGSGGVPLSAALAFAVVSYGDAGGYYCSRYTLAHEIGHILGATHDRPHANVRGAYAYSYGYGIAGRFGDIMSYFDPEVGLYANPNIIACDGLPCGIPAGKPKAADVAKTFTKTMATVSAFRQAKKNP